MFEVIMYDGGVYRSAELFEMIEDVGGAVLQKIRSSQMLTVTMSIPSEDKEMISALCREIGGEVKEVPLAGTEIAVVGPTLGRHHMPHPICDIAEALRRKGALSIVMGLARGRGKSTSQISASEVAIINEYDAAIFSLGNFKSCVEAKKDLLKDITIPLILVCGPMPEGMDDIAEAVISGVGRKSERMRLPAERAKLDEIVDTTERVLREKRKRLAEDPLFVHPSEVKQVLENYPPIDMCLRPSPIVLHLNGLRAKIPYDGNYEAVGNTVVYGRKLKDIADITESKLDRSSILIRIKTNSEVEYDDSKRNEGA
ncbi:MAG: methyl-coenzyme M reductase family protein [Candidatus Methanomethylophilaceae archaeon]|jgi:putative methanogenesis marker protein 7